jgi:uncharacterized protein YyaL (SSP411 family)
MVDLFWSADEKVFYDTGADHEELVVRPRDVFDGATPCGGSVAAHALLRLAVLTGDSRYERLAADSMRSVRHFMAQVPAGFANWVSAVGFYTGRKQEVVVIGPAADRSTQALLAAARRDYHPNRLFAGAETPESGIDSPVMEGRGLVNGKPTAFVCENYACQLPVTTPEELAAQLG